MMNMSMLNDKYIKGGFFKSARFRCARRVSDLFTLFVSLGYFALWSPLP